MKGTKSYYDLFVIADCNFQKLKSNPADTEAYVSLKREAQSGDNPWVVTRLAEAFITGIHSMVDRASDIERGIAMLEPLAAQGFAFAQFKLGEHYYSTGKRKKAIKQLTDCVKARIPEAAMLLAELLDDEEPSSAKNYRTLAARWGGFDAKGSTLTTNHYEGKNKDYDKSATYSKPPSKTDGKSNINEVFKQYNFLNYPNK